jgi:SWI/SNF-related matrix-associated actin-dependent regulator of chromatin subfamily A3
MPGYCVFPVSKSLDQLFISFQDGTKLADVNTHLVKVLGPLSEEANLQFDAIADVEALRELIGRSTKVSDAVGRFNINVYGIEASCQRVGKKLATDKVFLQRPDHQRSGTVYNNPHYFKVPGVEISRQELKSVQNNGRASNPSTDKVEDFRKAVLDVYSGLKRGTGLHRVGKDRRVITPLLQ